MQKLKSCPFCGGEPVVMSCDGSGSVYSSKGDTKLWGKELDHLLIRCSVCGVKTKAYKTEKGVFNSWNRRHDGDMRVYCVNAACPYNSCEHHLINIKKLNKNVGEVRVANLDGVCKDYLDYLLDEIIKEEGLVI